MGREIKYIGSLPDGGPPREIKLLPCGRLTGGVGSPYIVDQEGIEAAIAAFNYNGLDLVIDYERQTEGGEFASPDGLAPAAGWIKRLVNKGKGGLWAAVEWTDRAKRHIAAGEYRYFSPVFCVSRDSRKIARILQCALTNTPEAYGLKPLVASAGFRRM